MTTSVIVVMTASKLLWKANIVSLISEYNKKLSMLLAD